MRYPRLTANNPRVLSNINTEGISEIMRKPTPVVKSEVLSKSLGLDIWLKIEVWNPTGSHKDRESLKIMEECKRRGILEVGCASTGNFGISLAYYAKISGLRCHVWLPSGRAYPTVMNLIRAFSAELHLLDSDLDELYPKSSEEMANLNIYDVNPGKCLAKIAGNVEIGQEIINQIGDIDAVVCCVNNGTHLLGIAEGIQASGACIIGVYSYSEFASSIRGFNQAEGSGRIQEAVSFKGGSLVEATEQDLRAGVLALYKEGIVPEASSAAVVGIIPKIDLSRSSRICCVISGNGLKKPSELQDLLFAKESKH